MMLKSSSVLPLLVFSAVSVASIAFSSKLRKEFETAKADDDEDDAVENVSEWKWIPRNIESTIEKWIRTKNCVVYMRGNRRSGKSSTVKAVAKRLKRNVIELVCSSDNNVTLDNTRRALRHLNIEVHGVFDIGLALAEAVRLRFVVLIEEIQNASSALQVSIQQGIDHMAFSGMHTADWKRAGSLFLIGSLPGMVDHMLESRAAPLYQRVTAKISILPFDTLELVFMLANLGITDYVLMLSLHTLFGGRPCYYHIMATAGLFKGNNTSVESIISKFIASELAMHVNDAIVFLESQYDPIYCAAIKAVESQSTKTNQEQDLLAAYPECNTDRVFNSDLVLRYGVIESEYDISCLSTVVRYVIIDPMIKFALSARPLQVAKREDVPREHHLDPELMAQLEEFHFKEWVQEIAEDRRLILKVPAFPIPELGLQRVMFGPRFKWAITDCEIDIVASCPELSLLMLGSCRRNGGKCGVSHLVDHYEKLRDDQEVWSNLLKYMALNDGDVKVKFLHFAPTFDAAIPTATDTYFISLSDMLKPFEAESEKRILSGHI